MKIGDYVRTEYGIAKIIKIDKKVNAIQIDKTLNDFTFVLNEDINKTSSNIIDLIEIGDIIKYHPVQNNYVKTNILYKAIKNGRELIELEYDITHNKKSIISIVTKEQFKSMEYKVGEDNESN